MSNKLDKMHKCTNINFVVQQLGNPGKPATFAHRLPNVFQTSWTFGTRWVIVVQTRSAHWDQPLSVIRQISPLLLTLRLQTPELPCLAPKIFLLF